MRGEGVGERIERGRRKELRTNKALSVICTCVSSMNPWFAALVSDAEMAEHQAPHGC